MPKFKETLVRYCFLYNATGEQQAEALGEDLGRMNLRDHYSRLTAYATEQLNSPGLAKRAWRKFGVEGDRTSERDFRTLRIGGPDVLKPIEEDPNIGTNGAVQYGLSVIRLGTLAGGKVPAAPTMLIHLHIAKNGGTSLGRMLRMKLAVWPPTHWLHPVASQGYPRVAGAQRVEIISQMSPRQRSRVFLFEGHRGFGAHELVGDTDPTYLTVLRDPVDRTLSALDEVRLTPSLAQMSLEEFLAFNGEPRWDAHRYPFWSDNGQVRYLAGEGGRIIDVPAGEVTREMLDLAMSRIDRQIAFTGLLERWDESLLLLAKVLEWSGCFTGRSRAVVTDGRRRDHLDAETITLVERHNQLDLALYRHAEMRLNEHLQETFREPERSLVRQRRRANLRAPIIGLLTETAPRVARMILPR